MRHRAVVDGLVAVFGDLIAEILALEIRCVGKHVAAGDVAHCVDAFHRCPQAVVALAVAARGRLPVGILDSDVIDDDNKPSLRIELNCQTRKADSLGGSKD